MYADPYGAFTDCFAATEYCTPVYDLERFEIVKLCATDKWEWTEDVNYFMSECEKHNTTRATVTHT